MADRRRYIWPLLAALLTFVALLPAAPAHAQEDGVTVDPDSPSGREYDIPTERARRDAGGSKKKKANKDEGNEKAPLFGEGVGEEPTPTQTPPATATAEATRTPSAASRKKAKERRERAAAKREADKQREAEAAAVTPTATPSPTPPAVNARIASADTTGGSSWALIGGILVVLVAAGTGGGLWLRRRFDAR